ncbi:MAG: GNAT family N-acetyltransferase [Cyanobacteria bacterium J06639_14]
MTTCVRLATLQDLAEVLQLYCQPALDDGIALTLDDAVKLFRKMQRYPNYSLYVAELQGQVVGTFTLLIMDNLIHQGTPSAIVEAVAVDPKRQGQGIGKQMMQWAIAHCRQAHCYKLVISAHRQRDRAHAFYESLGFTKHGYSFQVEV